VVCCGSLGGCPPRVLRIAASVYLKPRPDGREKKVKDLDYLELTTHQSTLVTQYPGQKKSEVPKGERGKEGASECKRTCVLGVLGEFEQGEERARVLLDRKGKRGGSR